MKKKDIKEDDYDKYSPELINQAEKIYTYRVMIFKRIFIIVLVIVYVVYFVDYVLEGGQKILETLALISAFLFAGIVVALYSDSQPTQKQIDKICKQLLEDEQEKEKKSEV